MPLRLTVLVLLVAHLALLATGAVPPLAQDAAAAPAVFVCPPCGADCHFTTHEKGGACLGCGMALVPLSSVPQVGVLLVPDADLVSSALALGLFARSGAVRAFTVADVTEPLRPADALEVVPQFAFADAPPLDVLVVPDGYGAWEDELVVEWVRAAAERADHVIAVGNGALVLARAGLLGDTPVPATRLMARIGPDVAPGLALDGTLRAAHVGKVRVARDAGAAIDAVLEVVRDLAGEERARLTAEELGLAWQPEAR